MDKKEKILSFIRQKGPSMPGLVYKEIESDTIMTSAIMSEMASNGMLIISHVKVGGSPLYYIKGQESALINYINKLHEKEQKAVLLLKEKQVLRDILLDPVTRVSLRQTKDFAKPFTVNLNDKKEIFWKWFLFNDSDLIKKKVHELINLELNIYDINKENVQNSDEKQEKQNDKDLIGIISKSEVVDKILTKEKPKEKIKEKKYENKKDEQQKLEHQDIFIEENLAEELKKMKIEVLQKEVIKKNKEFDMIIYLPSTVGKLKYFCKFLDKKIINDKDISSAFVKGQMEKLPVLVLITGDLNKKAEKIVEDMKGITIKKINN